MGFDIDLSIIITVLPGTFPGRRLLHESLGSSTQILSTQAKPILEELYYIHFCRAVERHVMVLQSTLDPFFEELEHGVVPRDAADDDAA